MVLIQKTLNFPLRDTIFFYKQIPATKKVKLKIETMKAKLGLIPTKKKNSIGTMIWIMERIILICYQSYFFAFVFILIEIYSVMHKFGRLFKV